MSTIKIENYSDFLEKIDYIIKGNENNDVFVKAYTKNDKLIMSIDNENSYIFEFKLEQKNKNYIFYNTYGIIYQFPLNELYQQSVKLNFTEDITFEFTEDLIIKSNNNNFIHIYCDHIGYNNILCNHDTLNNIYRNRPYADDYEVILELNTNGIHNRLFSNPRNISTIKPENFSISIDSIPLDTEMILYREFDNGVTIKTKYLMELFSILSDNDVIMYISGDNSIKVECELDEYKITFLHK